MTAEGHSRQAAAVIHLKGMIMRKSFMTISSAALALLMFGTSLPSAQAAPLRPEGPAVEAQGDVVQVRHRRWHDGWQMQNRHNMYNGGREYRREFYRDRGYHYWRGHRGYDHYRPGYRRYNGFWFPAAAFATGAIIGGAISNSQPTYVVPRGLSRSHVEYCMSKYRSYRVSDNTYQPTNGPRRQCR